MTGAARGGRNLPGPVNAPNKPRSSEQGSRLTSGGEVIKNDQAGRQARVPKSNQIVLQSFCLDR